MIIAGIYQLPPPPPPPPPPDDPPPPDELLEEASEEDRLEAKALDMVAAARDELYAEEDDEADCRLVCTALLRSLEKRSSSPKATA